MGQVLATPDEPVSQVTSKPVRSSRLSLRDEALLGWFFCEGQSVFERSTFGTILSRQEHLAFRTKPCPRCNGMTFTDEDLKRSTSRLRAGVDPESCEPECSKCQGRGSVPDGRVKAPRPIRRHCKPCGGTGENLRRVAGTDLRVDVGCRVCDGTGMRDGYDANLDGDEENEPSHTPEDWALQRYAVASRRLSQIRPEHAEVLRAFFGLEGLRCGAGHPSRPNDPAPGRLYAVYQLTRAGRKWLTRIENRQELSRCGLLLTEWHLQQTQPAKWRRELLEACRDQARTLYEQASRAWCTARHGEGWRAEAKSIAERVERRRRVRVEAA